MIVQRFKRKERDVFNTALKYYSILFSINGINVTEREIQLVSFIAVNGSISYKHVKEEFCKEFNTSNATINNLVSVLKKLGILIKDDGKIKILPAIQLDFSKNIVYKLHWRMKPPNMHIKDYLIKKIAVNKVIENKLIAEKIIHKVIAHQFDSANDAIHKYNSVEFSGFGKFMFNMSKAKKRMIIFESQIAHFTDFLNDETLSPTVRRNAEMKLATAIDNRTKLKPKIDHGSTTDI